MLLRSLFVVLALIAAGCGSSGGDSAAQADSTGSQDAAEVAEQEAADPESEAQGTETQESEPAEVETTEAEAAPEPEPASAPVAERELILGPASLTPDCSVVPSSTVGLQTGTITSGGLSYDFQFIVPSSYDGSTAIPLVLDFHGIGSNGPQQAIFSGVAALAEAEGFLALQPTGLPTSTDDRNSWELPQFEVPGRDDVQMVVDLIDFISQNICIDPGRVYSMGMSNGALFTAELVCDLSERIAAAVSVAGVTHDDSCSPTRAVPYLAFHGIDDTTVPFNGGGDSSLGADPFFEQVMPEEFSQFAADFGCTSSEDSSITAEVTRTNYLGCADGVELGFFAISGAGHTWPGSPISASIPSLGVTNTDIDATAIAWQFFQQNSLPGAIEVAG